MNYVLRRLSASKNKIIILSTVIGRIQHTHLINQTLFDDEQMADVVDRPQEIRIEIRLHIRLHILLADADLILIAVEELGRRILADGSGILI